MSQSIAVQTASSPRSLRSRNRNSTLDAQINKSVTRRASSTQPFEDALTGEEEQDRQDDEELNNILEFPQSNQIAANQNALVFDQNNRLRRADPNQTPTRFPTRPINRTQIENEFDENDPDTFLERLTSNGKGRRSRNKQNSDAGMQTNDPTTSSKRYNLRAQPSSAASIEKKKNTTSPQVRRLFRGPIGSEDEDDAESVSEESEEEEEEEEEAEEEEEEEEEDTVMHHVGGEEQQRQQGQARSIPSPGIAREESEIEEEVDELEEAEDEEAVAATLDLQRSSMSSSNRDQDNDEHQEIPVNNNDNDDFEDDLDEEAVRTQKAQTLQRRQSRKKAGKNAANVVQQQAEDSQEESEIDDDDTERAVESTQFVVRYRYTVGQNNVGRKKWTDEETQCLMSAMNEVMTGEDQKLKIRPYFAVLQLHGEKGKIDNLLASKNNLQLKDKVRNELLRRKREGIEIPAWSGNLFRTL